MPLSAGLQTLTSAWFMSFSTVHYLLFLPLAVGAYFLLPARARRPWLLIASYYFYFFAAPRHLVVLLAGTLASWLLGLFIAGGKGAAARRARLGLALAAMLGLLCFFKYNAFFAPFLSPLFARLGVSYEQSYFTTAAALGISFYTFTAVGYLIDTARGDVPPEKNLLNYALFLGFFPSVTMGPISRAGSLLPQLKDDTRRFDADGAADALRGMAVGFFKKLAVADTLNVYTAAVFGNLAAHSGGSLTLAALCFALQLYFDFSGYSDIAVASARLLGIQLPENFQNPYFATNFSTFWSRWHMSLSGFLQDYVFTPIAWSRWTEKLPVLGKRVQKPPVLSAIAATFLISGLWHGDTLCFLVWGALQALFRIGEELCHRRLGKPKKKPSFRLRLGKTALVLALWVESLVFFKVGMAPVSPGAAAPGTVADALAALGRQFSLVSPARMWQDLYAAVYAGFFPQRLLALGFIAFTALCLAAALWADWFQCFRLKGAPLALAFKRLRPAPRRILYYAIVLCCFAAFIMQSGGFGGGSFLYGGF